MTDPHSDPPSSTDDEPETPVWLPALGFALFLVGGLAWAVTPPMASATPPPLPPPVVVSAPPPPAPPTQQAAPAPAPPPTAPPLANPPGFPRPGGLQPRLVPGGAGGAGAPGMLPRPAKNHP
jgi:hypothetical protein